MTYIYTYYGNNITCLALKKHFSETSHLTLKNQLTIETDYFCIVLTPHR